MSELPLEELRAQRENLDERIRKAEHEATLTHNDAMDALRLAVEEIADLDDVWIRTSRRRRNALILTIGSEEHQVAVELYYDEEPEYPLGSVLVTVTDRTSSVRTDFYGIPTGQALRGLVTGWLQGYRGSVT